MPDAATAPVQVLPNGVRIALERRPHAACAAVVLWLAGGTREESTADAGHLHLLEHLLLRRTACTPSAALRRRIALLGGAVNAQIGREHLALIGRAPAVQAAELAALLVECLCEPGFDDADLALELSVIDAERTFVGQTPPDEALIRLAWPQHPLGRLLLPSAPAHASVPALRSLWARQCVGARLGVAVVGGFDLAAVGTALAPLETLPAGTAPTWGAPPQFVPGRYGELVEDRAATLLWALPCAPYARTDTRAWELAAVVLEHSLSAALRETGLAYACVVWPELYSDAGLIVMRLAAPPGQVAACADLMEQHLAALGAYGPAPEALDIARRTVQARALLTADDLEAGACTTALALHHPIIASPTQPSPTGAAMPFSPATLRLVVQ